METHRSPETIDADQIKAQFDVFRIKRGLYRATEAEKNEAQNTLIEMFKSAIGQTLPLKGRALFCCLNYHPQVKDAPNWIKAPYTSILDRINGKEPGVDREAENYLVVGVYEEGGTAFVCLTEPGRENEYYDVFPLDSVQFATPEEIAEAKALQAAQEQLPDNG